MASDIEGTYKASVLNADKKLTADGSVLVIVIPQRDSVIFSVYGKGTKAHLRRIDMFTSQKSGPEAIRDYRQNAHLKLAWMSTLTQKEIRRRQERHIRTS